MRPWKTTFATVPMRVVGPVKITGPEVSDEVMIPLATYETPLWASVNRGAKVSMLAGGIKAVIVDDRMTRSILLEASDAEESVRVTFALLGRKTELANVVSASSR